MSIITKLYGFNKILHADVEIPLHEILDSMLVERNKHIYLFEEFLEGGTIAVYNEVKAPLFVKGN